MNVFGAVHDPRYRMKGLDDRARELPEGVTGHSDRIMFGSDHQAGMGRLGEIHELLDGLGLRERLTGSFAPVAARHR
jgi:hypothetical protein